MEAQCCQCVGSCRLDPSVAHFFLCLSDGIFITLVPSLRPFPCSIALLDQMVRELGWLGVEVQLGLQNHSAAYFVIEVSLKALGYWKSAAPSHPHPDFLSSHQLVCSLLSLGTLSHWLTLSICCLDGKHSSFLSCEGCLSQKQKETY